MPAIEAAARHAFWLAVELLASLPLVADVISSRLGWRIFLLADARLRLLWGTVALLGAWPFLVGAGGSLWRRRYSADLWLVPVIALTYGWAVHETWSGRQGAVYGFEAAAAAIGATHLARLISAVVRR
jgi:cation transport ATPase